MNIVVDRAGSLAPAGASDQALPFSSRLSPTGFGLLLVLPVVALLLAIVVYPILYSFYLSLTDTNPLTGARHFVGMRNFEEVFASTEFWHSVLLTAYYVTCVTSIATLVALGLALLLRERFIGRPLLMAVTVLPWSLSTYAAAVVWRYVYSPQYGLLAAVGQHLGLQPFDYLGRSTVIPSLALVHAWQYAPLGTYFLLASLQVIPDELYRLAKVDGMGLLRRFRVVTLPYLRLPLAIYLVLVGGQAATAFDLIYFLTSGGPGDASNTLTFRTYQETFQNESFGTGSAMSWVLLILVTIVTVGYYALAMAPARRPKGAQ